MGGGGKAVSGCWMSAEVSLILQKAGPASSHSEGAKAPKGSKTGQGPMRKRLSSLSLHPILQCPIAENKSCSQDQIPGMEDKIHLLIGKLAVILQKDMHPGWQEFGSILQLSRSAKYSGNEDCSLLCLL